MSEPLTRRDLLRLGSAGALAGLVPTSLWAQGAAGGQALRCGFIGVGGRGTGLLNEVLALEGVDVVAICDIDPGNLRRALDIVEKAKGKRPEALGEGPYQYRDLLRRKDLDCVVIATPCNWHGRMYLDCLEADRHFYGEKPMAITVREIKQIHEARKRHPDVVCQFGFQWGASRARADAIRRVREGAIGELIEGRFHRHNGWGSLGRWFNKRELSGDWMLEQAVHEFNLMWWVTQVHPVAAFTAGRRNVVEPDNKERNVTDFYTTILEYPNGLVVHYTHGWINPEGLTGMATYFVGTKGALDVLGSTITVRGQGEPIRGQGEGGDTREHLRDFFDAVRAGDPRLPNCGIENGTAASYIGLLIRKALDAHRRVTLEEMLDDDRELPPLPRPT